MVGATMTAQDETGVPGDDGEVVGYEEYLVGPDQLDKIKQIAGLCPLGADASGKLTNVQATVWGNVKAAIRRNSHGAAAITEQELVAVKAKVAAHEQTVLIQRKDLQDFQGQLPVVVQAHAPGKTWVRSLYLFAMFLGSLVFAGVLVPTLELLVFFDGNTGEAVPGAGWKAGLTGLVIGTVLAVFAWLASAKNKDINPHNNTMEAIIRLLPLFLGLSVAIGIALFRWQQIGFSLTVVGMTIIECAIVGFIDVMAHRYAYRYAEEPQTLAAKTAQLAANIDRNLYQIAQDQKKIDTLDQELAHQHRAQDHRNQMETGKEEQIRSEFDAWTMQTFELFRPAGRVGA